MAEQHSITEVLTGATVVAVALGFFAYAAQSTGLGPTRTDTTTLTASFRTADGIMPGTDVRLAGVKIGTVTDMRLNLETYRAEAVLALDSGVPIPDDSTLAVTSEGLLGGNFLEVLPGGSPFALEEGQAFFDTQGSVSLITLLSRFVGASEGE